MWEWLNQTGLTVKSDYLSVFEKQQFTSVFVKFESRNLETQLALELKNRYVRSEKQYKIRQCYE